MENTEYVRSACGTTQRVFDVLIKYNFTRLNFYIYMHVRLHRNIFITVQFSKKTTAIPERPYFDPDIPCKRCTTAEKIHFFDLTVAINKYRLLAFKHI